MKLTYKILALVIMLSVSVLPSFADPIHDAAKSNNLPELKRLLGEGVDVDSNSPLGTPLAIAVRAGHAEAVDLLIKHKADVEVESVLGRPLQISVVRDRVRITGLLLQAGADPNVGKRSLPLATAAGRGQVAIVEMLLAYGAEPDAAPDEDRILALHEAAVNGHSRIVKLLLASGADANALTARHETALHFAVFHDYPQIAALLREITKVELDIDITESQLATADLEKGAEHTKYYCSICHAIGDHMGGEEAIGPNLSALEGIAFGSLDSEFQYSDAFKSSPGIWDIHSLNAFLYAPTVVVPGTKMGLIPLTDAATRIQIIAYLRTIRR